MSINHEAVGKIVNSHVRTQYGNSAAKGRGGGGDQKVTEQNPGSVCRTFQMVYLKRACELVPFAGIVFY